MSDMSTFGVITHWYCLVVMMTFYSLPTIDSVKLVYNQSSIPIQASSNTTDFPTLRPSLLLTPIPSLPPTIVSTTSSPIVATSSPPIVLSTSSTPSSSTTSPSLSFLPTRALCIGVRNKFKTPNGGCSIHFWLPKIWCSISMDSTTNYYPKDVCSECGECSDPQIATTSSPTLSSPTLSPTVSPPPTVSRGPTLSPTDIFLPVEGSTCSDTCGPERELVDNNNIKGQILKNIDVGKMKNIHCLDTSKITNMNSLFIGDTFFYMRFRSFNTDLSCWDVSSVTSMIVSK